MCSIVISTKEIANSLQRTFEDACLGGPFTVQRNMFCVIKNGLFVKNWSKKMLREGRTAAEICYFNSTLL